MTRNTAGCNFKHSDNFMGHGAWADLVPSSNAQLLQALELLAALPMTACIASLLD